MSTKFPHKANDLPEQPFYAILYLESVTIPGDERSRTCPGHGYPEHTVSHWNIEVFPNRDAWLAEITRRKGLVFGSDDFKAVRISPARIKTLLDVEVEE